MQEQSTSQPRCQAHYTHNGHKAKLGDRCTSAACTLVTFGFSSCIQLLMCDQHAVESQQIFGEQFIAVKWFDPAKGDPRA
jgi:hypothetical protein